MVDFEGGEGTIINRDTNASNCARVVFRGQGRESFMIYLTIIGCPKKKQQTFSVYFLKVTIGIKNV